MIKIGKEESAGWAGGIWRKSLISHFGPVQVVDFPLFPTCFWVGTATGNDKGAEEMNLEQRREQSLTADSSENTDGRRSGDKVRVGPTWSDLKYWSHLPGGGKVSLLTSSATNYESAEERSTFLATEKVSLSIATGYIQGNCDVKIIDEKIDGFVLEQARATFSRRRDELLRVRLKAKVT